VLGIAGHRGPAVEGIRTRCTALQLTNFWQDLEGDWSKGRLYVPRDLIRAAGASENEVAERRIYPAWRSVLQDVAGRTRELFLNGRPLADAVGGRLGWELRATWLGGVRILDRIEAAGFDVFRERPVLGWWDAPAIAWRMLAWR
jgi:phytoene synthase